LSLFCQFLSRHNCEHKARRSRCMRLFPTRPFLRLTTSYSTLIHFYSAERRCFSTSTPFSKFQVAVKRPLLSTTAMAPPMTTKTGKPLDKDVLESLLKRRLFFTPAFEIHAPVKGLFGKMTISLHPLRADHIETMAPHYAPCKQTLSICGGSSSLSKRECSKLNRQS
jgi:hypothetical protein